MLHSFNGANYLVLNQTVFAADRSR